MAIDATREVDWPSSAGVPDPNDVSAWHGVVDPIADSLFGGPNAVAVRNSRHADGMPVGKDWQGHGYDYNPWDKGYKSVEFSESPAGSLTDGEVSVESLSLI
jgi:hypothetical protein